jgi:hypothetical protein
MYDCDALRGVGLRQDRHWGEGMPYWVWAPRLKGQWAGGRCGIGKPLLYKLVMMYF